MKTYPKYLYTGRSINWFGCFASMAEAMLFIKQHGASCRIKKEQP